MARDDRPFDPPTRRIHRAVVKQALGAFLPALSLLAPVACSHETASTTMQPANEPQPTVQPPPPRPVPNNAIPMPSLPTVSPVIAPTVTPIPTAIPTPPPADAGQPTHIRTHPPGVIAPPPPGVIPAPPPRLPSLPPRRPRPEPAVYKLSVEPTRRPQEPRRGTDPTSPAFITGPHAALSRTRR